MRTVFVRLLASDGIWYQLQNSLPCTPTPLLCFSSTTNTAFLRAVVSSIFLPSPNILFSTWRYTSSHIRMIMLIAKTVLRLLYKFLLMVFRQMVMKVAAVRSYNAPERWEVRYLSWFDIQGNRRCLETGWRPHG